VTEGEVVAIMRRHVDAQFPKTCSKCHRVFQTYSEYVRTVTPIGTPVLFERTRGEGEAKAQLGTVSMANCTCGTTLSLSSRGRSQQPEVSITTWARERAEHEGITLEQLFERLRARLRTEALEEADRPSATGAATTPGGSGPRGAR
jgi:hypothetical protein